MTVELHVGYVGKTREGKRVEIVNRGREVKKYSYTAANGRTYTEDGLYSDYIENKHDIIGPWVEPVKSPIETVTQDNLVSGFYGLVNICTLGYVGMDDTLSQEDLEAAIETLILIRDAKVLK